MLTKYKISAIVFLVYSNSPAVQTPNKYQMLERIILPKPPENHGLGLPNVFFMWKHERLTSSSNVPPSGHISIYFFRFIGIVKLTT